MTSGSPRQSGGMDTFIAGGRGWPAAWRGWMYSPARVFGAGTGTGAASGPEEERYIAEPALSVGREEGEPTPDPTYIDR